MKKLLLTSAIVAVSGAAFAEVTWSGDAELGYRSHTYTDGDATATYTKNDDGHGFYFEADLNANASAELNDGITASIDYGVELDYSSGGASNDNALGLNGGSSAVTLDDFPTITLESSAGKLVAGDAEHAAEDMFSDIDGMVVGFTEAEDEFVIRGDTTISGAKAGVSMTAFNSDEYNDGSDLSTTALSADSLTIGLAGELNNVLFTAGYESAEQEDMADGTAVDAVTTMGVGAGYTWNGAKIRLAYTDTDGSTAALTDGADTPVALAVASDKGASSIGFEIGYMLEQYGLDVTAGLSQNTYKEASAETAGDDYTFMGYGVSAAFEFAGADVTVGYEDDNTDVEGDEGFTLDAAYEVMEGVTVIAGYEQNSGDVVLADTAADLSEDAYWIGTSYDLGGGASVFASWSNANEAGDPEYNAGTTVGLALSF